MNTTLVIMAAGIGSRFGKGIKQLASMGPNGEIIMDYSIYDAKEAGFNKVVFIIRKDLEEEFRKVIGNRICKYIDVDYVFQEIDKIPEGFSVPDGRTKPWGTGHAILCCKDVVKEPFVIINADDYYGKDAFVKLHDFLVSGGSQAADGKMHLGMAGFILKNTLSEQGTVTRGICQTDDADMLTQICETTGIQRVADGSIVCDIPEVQNWINEDVHVSMNMWAVGADFLGSLEDRFHAFLEEKGSELKSEFLLPIIIGEMLKKNEASVKVLETADKWIGITYQEDLEKAQAEFKDMIAAGKYPEKLWA